MSAQMNTTKYYSNKQEFFIASWLGWNKVAASGARNFHPGDIQSSKWLGECKTHTKHTNNITFVNTVWNKICNEAIAEFKDPILFVDNGEQNDVESTWCMCKESSLDGYISIDIKDTSIRRTPTGNIVFDNLDMILFLRKRRKIDFAAGISSPIIISLDDDRCIINLFDFKELVNAR